MNYRHAYHAGNFADVLKHVALLALLDHFGRKPSPYFYLDTHAGRGRYLITATETQRAGEYRGGVLRLLEASQPQPPPVVARYLDLVRELGCEAEQLVAYPGSPLIALSCMRGDDRAGLCELEPGETAALRSELAGDPRAQVHERDGYEALTALLPPREKRGLVLIDPPYEAPDEFERLKTALCAAVARWPAGVFAVWYPIKHGDAAGRFLERMAATGIRRQLVAELCVQRDDSPGGLNGAGLLIINPPWQLDELLAPVLPWLKERLAPTGRGRSRVSWQVPE
ncbi:MAG TPA: 23S rRNA (adenine(2030)-N(6))-methyltransferase RlmJ [Steroidobacteraceae bacterium]|nr:23S rRNA (adenine(2030)-N(6))-methyltransferase RlmJ [Steroidobacteraceae bacterium]